MQTAFKEWTVIVDALARGEQILILRKGGIREGKAGFQVASNSFWLFPTQFHQQRECVLESAQQRFDTLPEAGEDSESVLIQHFAKVAAQQELADWSQIEALEGQHVWRQDVIRERFEWGQKQAIFAFAVRVFRLPNPVSVPMKPQYGGCRSWVELEPEMPTSNLEPVLTDLEFNSQLDRFQTVIKS